MKLDYKLIEKDFEELKKKLSYDYTSEGKIEFVESFLRKHAILRNKVSINSCPECGYEFKLKIIIL